MLPVFSVLKVGRPLWSPLTLVVLPDAQGVAAGCPASRTVARPIVLASVPNQMLRVLGSKNMWRHHQSTALGNRYRSAELAGRRLECHESIGLRCRSLPATPGPCRRPPWRRARNWLPAGLLHSENLPVAGSSPTNFPRGVVSHIDLVVRGDHNAAGPRRGIRDAVFGELETHRVHGADSVGAEFIEPGPALRVERDTVRT